jgi:hypothetical protein
LSWLEGRFADRKWPLLLLLLLLLVLLLMLLVLLLILLLLLLLLLLLEVRARVCRRTVGQRTQWAGVAHGRGPSERRAAFNR